ncbi:serine/threonine-protein kinase [Micromonospora sp. LOL_024]|uniref:serine/threonine-protein kinase n=1 Tax=Micromonospora sp. LOL_024 TaxID=3345412 RepID=UPI003A851D0F
MSPFTPSLRLHDRYVLHDRIGLGGMSEVWRAEDEILGREVAVKVLAGTYAVDPDLRATIRREARAAARLAHPHVTQVYDYGEAALAGGTVVPYLVMELVDGQNLADRLAAGPLDWQPAFRMAAEVAAALAAAHRIGVVHRDIKPGNVMLTETGAKVLDFGIAAPTGPEQAGSGPADGTIMGTPAYTAPERLSADVPDPASDLYALGVLLYRAVTGEVPLPVHSWEDAVVVHTRRPPVPPLRAPGLPAEFAELARACLDPDPQRRPTAGQVAARFRAGAAGAAAGPSTAVLPLVSATAATASSHDAADDSVTRPLPGHPPTLVAAAGSWPATAGAGGPRRTTARGAGPQRQPRPARPPVGALVAAGLALLVGLTAVFALGDRDDGTRAAAPSASSAAPPTTTAPAAPTPSATPPTDRPAPVSLRQAAAELVALLAAAQLTGEIDNKAADRLRKEFGEFVGGRPKDHEKQIEDLRDRLDHEVDRGRLPEDVAGRLDDLLDRLETTLPADD